MENLCVPKPKFTFINRSLSSSSGKSSGLFGSKISEKNMSR